MYTEMKIPSDSICNGATPWGYPNSVTEIQQQEGSDRLWHISTPSHGGYACRKSLAEKYIPKELLSRLFVKGTSKELYFFEEDVDWSLLAYFMPHLFPQEAREPAKATLKHYYKYED